MEKAILQYRDIKKKASLGGGQGKIDKLKDKGYLTAEERISFLVDSGTFVEFGTFAEHQPAEFGPNPPYIPRDGVITGFAQVNGRAVGLYAHDKTVQGGSLGNVHAMKIVNIIDGCREMKIPLIALQDSVGARIQEGNKRIGFDGVFYACTQASGIIPLISAIFGRCAGGVAYSSALMDFVLMIRGQSQLFITGPKVIKAVTNEDVSFEELGGADVHSKKSGVCDIVVGTEEEMIKGIKELLSLLPDSNMSHPQRVTPSDDPDRQDEGLLSIIPREDRKYYNMLHLIKKVVDDGYFFEIKKNYAKNIITGFGRMDGWPVGIIANQPAYLAGALDINASDKGSRFIRFCDAFNIPVITFVDIPGYLPGIHQEHLGIIRHGAKMLYAYAEASVPKITVIIRKDYGGGKQAMCSKPMGTDLVIAWPSAELAVMGAEGAVDVIYGREIAKAENSGDIRDRLIDEYKNVFGGPYEAARKMYIDDIIEPQETRPKIINALKILRNKKPSKMDKKHGNIPL
ncbi:MAG: acyl-CoA carboxylase subunit beta [Deltaproteobacteria bacterium]|nr:acyl-CoA carboxylase subunit beta [Deltaproteobacteria bacterium]